MAEIVWEVIKPVGIYLEHMPSGYAFSQSNALECTQTFIECLSSRVAPLLRCPFAHVTDGNKVWYFQLDFSQIVELPNKETRIHSELHGYTNVPGQDMRARLFFDRLYVFRLVEAVWLEKKPEMKMLEDGCRIKVMSVDGLSGMRWMDKFDNVFDTLNWTGNPLASGIFSPGESDLSTIDPGKIIARQYRYTGMKVVPGYPLFREIA